MIDIDKPPLERKSISFPFSLSRGLFLGDYYSAPSCIEWNHLSHRKGAGDLWVESILDRRIEYVNLFPLLSVIRVIVLPNRLPVYALHWLTTIKMDIKVRRSNCKIERNSLRLTLLDCQQKYLSSM